MSSAMLPNLVYLSIDMSNGHGWDAGPLKTFVFNHHTSITDLNILFPACCGPFEFDLDSIVFPRLVSFGLTCSTSSPGQSRPDYIPPDFLRKHPTLQQLALNTFETPIDPSFEEDLTLLSRVRIPTMSWNSKASESLLKASDTGKPRRITHLVLSGCSSLNGVRDLLKLSDGESLRCLELTCSTLR